MAGQVAIIVAVIVVGLVGPNWPKPVAGTLIVAGALFLVLGLILLVGGSSVLGRSLTPLPKPKEGATLRETGVYGVVRHPMYGGSFVAALGWSMATTPWALIPSAVGAAFLELKSRREESWLAARYAGYEAYRTRVRWKFVPGIR